MSTKGLKLSTSRMESNIWYCRTKSPLVFIPYMHRHSLPFHSSLKFVPSSPFFTVTWLWFSECIRNHKQQDSSSSFTPIQKVTPYSIIPTTEITRAKRGINGGFLQSSTHSSSLYDGGFAGICHHNKNNTNNYKLSH